MTAELSSPGPLAALNEFDANLQLRIGDVKYRKTEIRHVRVDGSLVNGKLTLNDALVYAISPAPAYGWPERYLDWKVSLRFNGTVSAASNNLRGLFRVAGIESPVSPRKLGKMRLTAKTNVLRVAMPDADLQLAEARTRLTGSIDDLPGTPIFNISLDSRHPEMARLAALLSDGRPGPKGGPLTVKANVKAI